MLRMRSKDAPSQLSKYKATRMLHHIRDGRVMLCKDESAQKQVVLKQYWANKMSGEHMSEARFPPLSAASFCLGTACRSVVRPHFSVGTARCCQVSGELCNSYLSR